MSDVQQIQIKDVVWDPSIYPREKWSTATIERYRDALDAGEVFPPIIIEAETMRLLDGKQRLEAHREAGRSEISAAFHQVPEGMSEKYYSALLSSRHGDRITNADLKKLALEEFEADYEANKISTLDAQEWGRILGISQRTVYRWVSHIIERGRVARASKAWRLAQLGWTQAEIGERLGVDQSVISENMGNCHLAKIHKDLGPDWNEQGVAETAKRLDLPFVDAMAAAMQSMDDAERMSRLNIKIQPYDVWHFAGCHDWMGDAHPGRIPGELVTHILYFYTQSGDLVIDPMVGSGTTLDACLLMGRKCRGYDIDDRHERFDVEAHDLSTGWPNSTAKASLVFWDPPYFDKMDKGNMADGYVDGSISGLAPDDYLAWIKSRLSELNDRVKPRTTLAFLMSGWDSENAKQHQGHKGIFVWDYAALISQAGWTLKRHISCPLSTQQVHASIVEKFRKDRRLARLDRSLLIAVKEQERE